MTKLITKLIPNGEIAIKYKDVCDTIVDALLSEGYVVMLSREEDFYIINYVWADESDRNNVVFMSKDTFEERFYEEDEEDIEARQYKLDRLEEDAKESVWNITKKLLVSFPSQIEEIFGVSDKSEKEKDRFWVTFPDQYPYSVVEAKIRDWDRKRMEPIEDAVMEEAIKAWDNYRDEEINDSDDYVI